MIFEKPAKLPDRVFFSLIVMLLFYFTGVILCEEILNFENSSWINLYLIILMSTFTLESSRHLFRSLSQDRIRSFPLSSSNLLFMAICGITLIIWYNDRLQLFYNRSIWLDEYHQFTFANTMTQVKNIIFSSAHMQQPPLDYYLTRFASRILGDYHYNLRFHSQLFSCLLVLTTLISIKKLSNSILASVIGAILILSSNLLPWQTNELRPYILSSFIFLLYLQTFFTNLKEKIPLVLLVSIQFIYALSIGLQPLCMIFCLSLISLVFYCDPEKKSNLIHLYKSNIVCLILFSPFIFIIVSRSGAYLASSGQISISDLFIYLKELTLAFHIAGPFYPFLLGLFWIIWFFLNKKSEKPPQKELFLTLAILLPPLIFFFLYKFFINYPLNTRYMANYLYSLPIFISLVLAHLFRMTRTNRFLRLSTLIFLLFFFFFSTKTDYRHGLFKHEQKDWKSFYSSLLKAPDDTIFIPWVLSPLGEDRYTRFIGLESYVWSDENYKRFFPNISTSYHFDIMDFDSILSSDAKIIIFVSPKSMSRDKLPDNFNSNFMKMENISDIRIFKVNVINSISETLKKYFEYWIQVGGEEDWNFHTWEALAILNFKLGETDEGNRLLLKLKSFIHQRVKQGRYSRKEAADLLEHLDKLNQLVK